MVSFIFRRTIYGLLVLFGVITVIFFLFNAKPGNPALMLGGNHATAEVIANIERDLGLDLPVGKRYLLYLNDVLPVSIHDFQNEKSRIYYKEDVYGGLPLFGIGSGKKVVVKAPYLRRSYRTKRGVSELIADKMPDTIILALAAIILASIFGVILGVLAAMYKGSFYDNASFIFAVSGMSAPSFFVGAIVANVGGVVWAKETNLPAFPLICALLGLILGLIWFFTTSNVLQREKVNYKTFIVWTFKGLLVGLGIWLLYVTGYSIFNYDDISWLEWSFGLPGTGLNPSGPLIDVDDYTGMDVYKWENLILPVLTLGVRPLAIIIQLTRSSMLDVLTMDYIRTARAKGLSNFRVVMGHALKNALNPVVTAVSSWFASLLAGAVFIEIIFGYNGLGYVMVEALRNDDLPIVMGSVLVISTFFVLINILVDIIYGFLDPRVRIR